MRLIWTYEVCKETALKFKTKKDFLNAHSGAYAAAHKKKWINDICSHMIPLGDKYNRCIYAYEFSDNSAYIGLTCSIEDRNKAHTNVGRKYQSAVKKHIFKTGLTPKLVQLTEYIVYWKASKEETNWANKYKANGWTLLNVRPTGSLSMSNSFYTKAKCKEILLAHEYKQDVYKKHPNIFTLCKNKRWHSTIIKKLKLKKKNYYWTKERCARVVKSVSTISELLLKNRTVYNAICNNGWKEELTNHMTRLKKPFGYWNNKEVCREVVMKVKNKKEFQRKYSTAYKYSKTNNWLDEFFPKKPK